MYEGLLHTFMREMHSLSGGELNCLPYTRSLLDFFEARSTQAIPLVVRCVVFGRCLEGWDDLPMSELVRTAVNGQHPNGGMEFVWPQGGPKARTVSLRYRTLGYTHGRAKLGDYSTNGRWSGHLVVVTNGFVIDPTIGQLNDPDFLISFNPPYEVVEADEGFLAGRSTINGVSGGKWVCYSPYIEERTYQRSKSWTDPVFRQQLREVGLRVANMFKGKPDSALHELPSESSDPEQRAG